MGTNPFQPFQQLYQQVRGYDPKLYQALDRVSGTLSSLSSSVSTLSNTDTTNLESPLNFGAKGDGITDDSSAVSNAIAALGYLWLPPGIVFVTKGITITTPGFNIFGGGGLKLVAGAGTDLLHFDGSAQTGSEYPGNGFYAHVFNVLLHGNAANQPANNNACLALINAAYTTVQDCLIYAASGDGIRLENHNGNFQADECNIINNRIFSSGRNGIYFLPTTDTVNTTIASNISVGKATVTPASMANIGVGSTLIVANSDTTNLEYVVVLAITATTFTATFASTKTGPGITVISTIGHVGDHVIIGNHCNYNTNSGIKGTYLTSGIIACNNVLTNGTGIILDAADRCDIVANACRNNKGSGIIIEDDQSGEGLGRAKQILITANEIHYNGVQTTGDELDVFNTDGCMISHNYLGDDDFTPVAAYGIQLSNCTGIVIIGNIFGPVVHSTLLAPVALPPTVSTTIAANIATGNQTVTPASMTNIFVGTVLVITNPDTTHSETTIVNAITGTTFTALFQTTKTGPGITVLTNGTQQQPYRTLGNIDLSDGMQGNLAAIPTPAANDYGLLYTVTDYYHQLLWIGTQWVFAPGDQGSGWIAGSVGGVLTYGVWHICDGTAANVLQGGGTTRSITTPDMSAIGNGQWYMRC